MQSWFRKRLNWKVLLMSVLINKVAIGLTAFILPGVVLIDNRLFVLVIMARTLGLVNTFVKPLLQLLTIRLLFVTYGLVLIISLQQGDVRGLALEQVTAENVTKTLKKEVSYTLREISGQLPSLQEATKSWLNQYY
jgi:Mycobacterial 4 TMS phage holin, superfamily IV